MPQSGPVSRAFPVVGGPFEVPGALLRVCQPARKSHKKCTVPVRSWLARFQLGPPTPVTPLSRSQLQTGTTGDAARGAQDSEFLRRGYLLVMQ